MKKAMVILWLGMAAAVLAQNNFLDLQNNGLPASKVVGLSTNGVPGPQGPPGRDGTNNAVTVTNFVSVYQTNIYVTLLTNSTTVLQTNAVTVNSTNAVTTFQTNFTTVNFTNTILQTNVVNGGVATSGWPTQWAWVSITNQPTLGTASASNTAAFVLNSAAGIKAAGGDTNVPGAYDLAGAGTTAAQAVTNGLLRTNGNGSALTSLIYSQLPYVAAASNVNAWSGTVTNRAGYTNSMKFSGGVFTNWTKP